MFSASSYLRSSLFLSLKTFSKMKTPTNKLKIGNRFKHMTPEGHIISLRGDLQKKPSIFKDIVQIGGREVNPISKN